ncbi:ADP-ribose pyrophosphatase [Caldisphaera lagunensis DSM 15908]|uniref:ADP-ribose pyrophosphatase n=1 Tax=Caldisphaera lagunensis (strain DSM 15908 / JCM 11604 / ANMR 0165 / IC-154) TaxID=1056495 RepID=L0A9M0_CALLD|nr:NUDIX hydrolase [Caldisphaera lagunensis]AFZ70094.1 ADP-ribose pyrophosphatase [Caldisphaera lagunensis DSM 15908]
MGRTYPNNPLVGVGTLLIRDNKILLIKRLNDPERGKWAIPGGHVELGEKLMDAAKREFLEETNIDTEPLGVVNVDEIITKQENKVLFHYVLITVLMKDNGKTPKAGSDAEDVKFVDLKDTKKLNDISITTQRLITKILTNEVNLERPIPVITSSPY